MSAKVQAVVLAAGRSSRTAPGHKLLATFDGVPLVRRSVLAALGSGASGVSVVVGCRDADIGSAINDLPVSILVNPRWAEGLSTSLGLGFAAVPSDTAGVLVMLADQPLLEPAHLDRLLDAFAPSGEGSIVIATDNGRFFNPVVISRLYDAEIAALSGDVGARRILAARPGAIRRIELGRASSCDADTVEAILALGGVPEASSPSV